jgi:hypothetical protein
MRLCLEAEEETVTDALLFDAIVPVFTLAVPSALN